MDTVDKKIFKSINSIVLKYDIKTEDKGKKQLKYCLTQALFSVRLQQ